MPSHTNSQPPRQRRLDQLPPPPAPGSPHPQQPVPPQPLVGQPSGQPTPEPYQLKRTVGRIAWVSAVVVLSLSVLAFASGRGFSITGSQGGPSLQVDAPLGGAATPEQVDQSQDELAAELAEANEELARETSPVPATVNIAGQWFGDSSGGTYFIEQSGTAATITETDGFGNITAVGQGTLTGSTFSFNYDSAAGTSGFGELSVDASGRFLNGYWEDGFGRRPAQLSRV